MSKAGAEQLADVFIDVFNLSLAQAVVSDSFKTASIVQVPKRYLINELITDAFI